MLARVIIGGGRRRFLAQLVDADMEGIVRGNLGSLNSLLYIHLLLLLGMLGVLQCDLDGLIPDRKPTLILACLWLQAYL